MIRGAQHQYYYRAAVRAVTHIARLWRAAIRSIPPPFGSSTLLGCLLCVAVQVAAQQLPVQAGAVLQLRSIPGGMAGRTATGQFEVVAWSPHIIRVRFTTAAQFAPLPYALQQQAPAQPVPVSFSQQAQQAELRTTALRVQVQRQPVLQFRFFDAQGQLLSEDAAGPDYGIQADGGRLTNYRQLPPDEKILGMGEALGPLNRRGSVITLDNTDNYKYGDPRVPMYSSIPFFMGVHTRGMYGLFLNNSYRSVFNFGASTPQHLSLSVAGGDLDYFFIHDTSLLHIVSHYASLTGTTPLPPLWSLGYQQSRCSYYPQSQVEWLAQTFRQKQLPLDGIVLDADYQKDYRPFTVDSSRFPDMAALAQRMRQLSVRLTASVYPGMAADSSYHAYRSGLAQQVFVTHPSGRLFTSEIAPVTCHFPDYTKPAARQWWIQQMHWLQRHGIDGYWNDMNEPAVAASMLPDNLRFDFDGRGAGTREAKNVYGFQMARSSYEAARQYRTGLRPFVLSRAGFAGIQRYAALWSGDNTASEEGLMTSVLLNTQLSLSGVSFCGYDIGGYIGDAPKDQFIRWMQLGMFSPYCRNHRGYNTVAGEPWAYGEEAEDISRRYMQFRYQLLPLWYSLFRQSAQVGTPVLRSLAMHWPQQSAAFEQAYQYQFLLGSHLMVVPAGGAERSKAAWLPPGTWYNAYTDSAYTGARRVELAAPLQQLPLLVRESAIIPMQSVIQHTAQAPTDTLVLHLYHGQAEGELQYYEDAGDGYAYEQGDYYQQRMLWQPALRTLQLLPASGQRSSQFRYLKLVLHGLPQAPKGWQLQGQVLPLVPEAAGLLPTGAGNASAWSVVLPFHKMSATLSWLPQ